MREQIIKIIRAAVLSLLLLAAVVLCATATIKLMDLILHTGIEDLWAAGIKAGFIAWLVLSVMILVRRKKGKQSNSHSKPTE